MLDAVPDQPDALHLLATVARETGRADLAIDLYRRLLRRHPAIPIAHNSLGNLLQEREEWQEAIACYEAAFAHDPRYASACFNLGRVLLHMNDLMRAEHVLRQAAALGERYLDHVRTLAPGAARVTDKLPGNYLHLEFITTILPGATIVHCRRDPQDNAVSLYFTDFMVGHEYSNDLRAIGRQIRGMRALMAHWETVLGERLLTLDYEAVVADPEPRTRAMVARVGLEWDDACLRPHEVARTVRTASAWQVRQPVYRRSAGRARAYDRFLGPLREGLGEAAPVG